MPDHSFTVPPYNSSYFYILPPCASPFFYVSHLLNVFKSVINTSCVLVVELAPPPCYVCLCVFQDADGDYLYLVDCFQPDHSDTPVLVCGNKRYEHFNTAITHATPVVQHSPTSTAAWWNGSITAWPKLIS